MNRLPLSHRTLRPPIASPEAGASGLPRPTGETLLRWSLVPLGLAIAGAVALWPNVWTLGLAGIACVWAAVRSPLVFVILTIWTFVAPTVYVFEIGSFGVAPYVLFESLAIVGLVAQGIQRKAKLVSPPGVVYLVVFAVLTSLSALISSNAVNAVSLLVRLWLAWIMVFLVLMVVPNQRQFRNLLAVLVFQALVVVGVSVVSSLSNLDVPSFPSLLFLHFQKNDYATYLSFAAALALIAMTTEHSSVWYKGAGVALLILVGISWPLTYSRSGLMSLAAMLIALALLHRTARVIRSFGVALLVAAVAWVFLPSEVKTLSTRAFQSLLTFNDRERDSFAQTYEDRIILDWAAVDSIAEKPLLGLGLGEWQQVSPVQVSVWDLKRQEVVSVGAAVHNRYLLIAAESGIFALLAYGGFLVALIRLALQTRKGTDQHMRLALNALLACTMGFLVSNLAVSGTLWEWNLLAVLAAAVHVAQPDATAFPARSWRPRVVTARPG